MFVYTYTHILESTTNWALVRHDDQKEEIKKKRLIAQSLAVKV